MKQSSRTRAAIFLTTAVTVLQTVLPVQAAAPEPAVDETMYVNLDYYGQTTKINVVKGVAPNGVASYTDYGDYEKVVNMTDKTEPVQENGAVTWSLPEDGSRFYYQCTMKESQVELPWTFDVSYLLNGVPADAAQLAGASGVVGIHVKAEPNEAAKEYYRNNMVLSVVIPVDMEECYSVDAPGAQVQAVGSTTAVVFAALPGEEGDYTVRIGTDDFETTGILMMMVPGTLDTLEHVKDIKEAKDTWKEDGDRIYDSMDRILAVMEEMKPSVSTVSDGLGHLNQAWSVVSEHRPEIEALSTRIVEELLPATEQLSALIPHLDTAKAAVEDISEEVSDLSDSAGDLQKEMDHLTHRISRLKNLLNDLADMMDESEESDVLADFPMSATASQLAGAASDRIGSSINSASSLVTNLRSVSRQMVYLLEDAQDLANTIDDYSGPTLNALNDVQELLIRTSETLTDTQSLLRILNTVLVASGNSLDTGTRESLQGLKAMLDQSMVLLDEISEVRSAGKSMKETLDGEIDELEEDTNFLNMDPEAEKVSFTSEKNREPNSLQIILRTDEISGEDDTTDISDMETESTDGMTPFQRMWHVIVEIFRAVIEIFKNR